MRRAVAEIIDPTPVSMKPLWEYFEGRCAYCGKVLEGDREGQVDHAISGGGNQFANLVLACGTCNGDEKRELSWQEFLATKASGTELLEREALIRAWFELHRREPASESAAIANLRVELEALVDEFGAKCKELKELVGERSNGASRSPGGVGAMTRTSRAASHAATSASPVRKS